MLGLLRRKNTLFTDAFMNKDDLSSSKMNDLAGVINEKYISS